jgi:UPF0755 protein
MRPEGEPERRQGEPERRQGEPERRQGEPERRQGEPVRPEGEPARPEGELERVNDGPVPLAAEDGTEPARSARRGQGTRRVRGRASHRGNRVLLTVGVVIVAMVVAGLGWAAVTGLRSVFAGPADYEGPPGPPTEVRITPGDTATDIGGRLADAGVVASQEAFVAAARADERSTRIQPGTYRLPTRLPAADALAALLDPASRLVRRVTVPEGLRLTETINRLAEGSGIAQEEFAAVVRRAAADPTTLGLPPEAPSPEGYLFPATYDVEPDTTAEELVGSMVETFYRNADEAGLTSGRRSLHELVTIASLVEAEARRPQDRGPVARVIENRLAAGMPLQLDSTVNYALRADKTLVTYDDLAVESAYNTYQHAGLPPGPINSPGLAAMQAAAAPPPGDWLYFVTVDPATGLTKFTASYEEFLQFKAELKANQ